jgi:antitoxin component HigA of HigAB toxin-antitoxin module
MGRLIELITDVAASADEEGTSLTLSPGDFDRLRDDWGDDEIEDALALAQTAFHHEAVNEAADSLSARVIEVLGTFADEKRFQGSADPGAPVHMETLAQLARSVSYLEEALSLVRDAPPPDRTRFNELLERLANRGIEAEMTPLPRPPGGEDEIEH